MRIKKLSIKSFGKLENKELELEEGFNIIYGENESGKSTIQSFIKAMLYGVDGKKGKKRLKDRVKYTPIGKGEFSGELLIEDEGKEILIDRTFGKIKKLDSGKVFDNLTGEEILEYNLENIGKDILGISSEEFKNTLYISQLGCKIENSKEDEILNRIMNILESGEDEVSYKKIKTNLEEAKKKISNTRKSGQLDKLKNIESKLLEERFKREKIHEENIEDELKLLNLKEERENINELIKNLEVYKDVLKKRELEKEVKNLREYLNKKEELIKKKELLEKEIGSFDSIEKINEIKDEIGKIEDLKLSLSEKEAEYEKLNLLLEEKKEALKRYGILNELPSNVEPKIIELILEESNLKEKYKSIEDIKNEVFMLKEKRDDFLSHLNTLNLTNEKVKEIEEDLKLYEIKSKEDTEIIGLEEMLEDFSKKESRISLKIRLFRVLQGFLLIGEGITLFTYVKDENIFKLAILIFIMLILLYTLAKNKYYKKQLIELEKEVKEVEKINNTEEEVKLLKDKINGYKTLLKAKNRKEILETLEDYKFVNRELDLVSVEIKAKEDNLLLLKENYVKEKLIDNQKFIGKLLRVTRKESLEEILESLKEKSEEDKSIKILNEKIDEVKIRIDESVEEIIRLENKIKDLSRETILENVKLSSLNKNLDEILNKIKEKNEVKLKLENIEESYNLLLKGRNIEDLERKISNNLRSHIEIDFSDEEEILSKIKLKNKELLEKEKEIKDVEYLIKEREASSRSLFIIDGELHETREKIKSLSKKEKAIDVTLIYMEKAFKKLQKSFGPVINKKVCEVFGKVTGERYKDLRVSEDYNLSVRNLENNSIMDSSYLSTGTYDQIYLALRLGIIDIIFDDKKVPIILDESLASYDNKRLERMLEILYEKSKKDQVILFTCNKREINILKGREGVNILTLN